MLDNNKLFYHLRGLHLYFYPRALLNKDRILEGVERRSDYEYIKERVEYYNKLGSLGHSSLGMQCNRFAKFRIVADSSLASPSKFSKNSKSTTANIRMLLDSSGMKSLDSSVESGVDSVKFLSAKDIANSTNGGGWQEESNSSLDSTNLDSMDSVESRLNSRFPKDSTKQNSNFLDSTLCVESNNNNPHEVRTLKACSGEEGIIKGGEGATLRLSRTLFSHFEDGKLESDSLVEDSKELKDSNKNLESKQDSIYQTNLDSKDSSVESKVDFDIKLSLYPQKQPYHSKTSLGDFKLPRKSFVYFFDSYEYLRYFKKDAEFILEKGDVNYNLSTPCICKSRPIYGANYNNILLNLDKVRHFRFLKDKIAYEDKDDILFFRGGVYQSHRLEFLEKYFLDSRCDLGHTGSIGDYNKRFYKPRVSIKEHLRHKFILSLEGNDVASNLKWIMSSNSIAVMPKPKFETWFMEGRLRGDYHYIEISEDYSDVFDKLEFYKSNPARAKEIIKNANAYCKQFFDKQRERIIALLVLEKYFSYVRF